MKTNNFVFLTMSYNNKNSNICIEYCKKNNLTNSNIQTIETIFNKKHDDEQNMFDAILLFASTYANNY